MKRLSVWFFMWLLMCGISCPTPDLHAQSHLVAAYGLDEGGGSIAEDASGNSNNGTVLGGVWTTSGRFGNALSFDGTRKGRVDISSSASLDLQNGMTLEAWVYVIKKTGSRTVISKKKPHGLSYALYVSGLRPVAFISLGKKKYKVKGIERLPLNTWVHLAATYDGTTLQLYVDGNLVGSQITIGQPIDASANPVSIGSEEVIGKKQFWGSIDEVRIYNRALSQAEIQNDMATSISNLDIEPPSTPSGLTATPVGSTQINLSWTASTDNVGVTGYQVERCQGSGCSNFSLLTTVTGTSYSNTGLQEITSYSYRVRATDAANNLSGYSNTATAATLDIAAPTVTAFTIPSTATTLTVSITSFTATDNVGVTGYLVTESATPPSAGAAGWSASAPTSYTFTTAGTKTLYAWAKDAAGNVSTSLSATVTITLPDPTPPTAPSGLTATPVGSTQINLSWTASTDNVGVTGYQVERCQGSGCSNFSLLTTVTGTSYSNTGLQEITSYSYRVRATDAANNLSGYSNTATAATLDIAAPTVTAFTIPSTATTLTVSITSFTATDNVGVTGYLLTQTSSPPSAGAAGWSASAPTSYTFTTAGTKTLYAWAKDAAGNVSTSLSASVVITLETSGPEPAGWYAGDMHVHRSCGDSPESISSIYTKMEPQNLAFVSLLADMGNGEVKDPVIDLPRVDGTDDPVSTPGQVVHWDAEWHWDPVYSQYPHQALGGHIVALGLTHAEQRWDEYTYPIFQWAHSQNAIAGFVHMQYLDNDIPQTLNCCIPIEYPVEVALGSADFISEDVVRASETVSGMDPESAMLAYYRLLNCGFRPGLAAGTDHPCNASGADLGSLLTYTQVAGDMTYRNWIDGIKNGRTVVSRNGHNEFLNLVVNNSATPGDQVNLTAAGNVPVTITWTANQNLTGTIELVQNGVVVASEQKSVTSTSPATVTTTLSFTKSGWLIARRMGNNKHYVHTAAVFVLVNNAPIRASADDANFYVDWMDNLLEKTSSGGAWNQYFTDSLDEAQARYQAARAIFQQIADEATE